MLSRPLPRCWFHRRIRALSDLGNDDFLARKIFAIPEWCCLKSEYKRTQIARKTNSFTIYNVAGNISREFNFADFFRFCREKNHDFTRENNFSWNSCTVYLKVTNGIHMGVFVTLFATNLIEVQQSKKAVNFCWIFVGESLFSRDLIIADQ